MVLGCVSDNEHSPCVFANRAAFSQVRNNIGNDCRHTYLCGPSNETMAFLDRARDANIATAIPRLRPKRAAIPHDRTQQKISVCFLHFRNVHVLCDLHEMSTTCTDDHRKTLPVFQPDEPWETGTRGDTR